MSNTNHYSPPRAMEAAHEALPISRLAHEVRNPLSTIKVNLKLIGEKLESDSPDLAGAASKIRIVLAETERIERILNDFVAFQDDVSTVFGRVHLGELLAEIADFYQPRAAENGIAVRTELPASPLYCIAEPGMLKQVILNLFINAQHAMPDGGELFAGLEAGGDEAVIRIADTGCGMTADVRERIFQPYFSRRTGGSGLGLAIVRKIVLAHGGKISVESEPGRGTLFTINLPLEKQQ